MVRVNMEMNADLVSLQLIELILVTKLIYAAVR